MYYTKMSTSNIMNLIIEKRTVLGQCVLVDINLG